MWKRADDRNTRRQTGGRCRSRIATAGLCALALAFAAAALPGAATAGGPASGSPFSFQSYEALPERLQYADDSESRPPSVSYERNELRAVQAPTKYRVGSLLRYTMELGDTGMQLRVRVKPKMRKIFKVELRF